MDEKYEGFDEDYDTRKARERSLSAKYIDKTGYTDKYTIEEDVIYLIKRLQKEIKTKHELQKAIRKSQALLSERDSSEEALCKFCESPVKVARMPKMGYCSQCKTIVSLKVSEDEPLGRGEPI